MYKRQALRSVTYSNSSDTPVTASRTISFVVDDGEASSTAADRTVTVTQTNDAPIVTVPGGISVIEDTASSITGISFSDADAGAGSVTVTLSVPSGSLSATSGGGVTVGGSASALTLSGSIGNINAFIAGGNVSFLTAVDNTASVTLTASINDNGLSGGAPKSDSATVLLTVSEVNDAPTISAPASINVTEDVPQALTGISFEMCIRDSCWPWPPHSRCCCWFRYVSRCWHRPRSCRWAGCLLYTSRCV